MAHAEGDRTDHRVPTGGRGVLVVMLGRSQPRNRVGGRA